MSRDNGQLGDTHTFGEDDVPTPEEAELDWFYQDHPDNRTNPVFEAALSYAQRGWYIFPCNQNKRPHVDHSAIDVAMRSTRVGAPHGRLHRGQ